MKNFCLAFLTAFLLLSAAPSTAEGWTDIIIEWVTSLFSSPSEEDNEKISEAEMARLRSTPLVELLSNVPDSDTIALRQSWPYISVDVEADLDRRQRLLDQTVLLANPGSTLPMLTDVEAIRIIYRSDQRPFRFIEMARRFTSVQEVMFDELIAPALPAALDLPTIVVADDPPGASPFNADWYHSLYGFDNFTLVHFGDPVMVTGSPKNWSLINCPLRAKESEAFIAQALFGAQSLNGRLQKATPAFAAGAGIDLEAVRAGFRAPEMLGINRDKLERLDNSINRAIRYHGTPGAQLAVFKGGQLVYEKAYGSQTYGRGAQPVTIGDLYDLASVTKVAATSLAVMKLYDEGKIDLKAQVQDYLPEYSKKVPGRYRIDQLLTHQTGLQADLPLYNYIGKQYVSPDFRDNFSMPLSQTRWLDASVPAKIRTDIGRVEYTRRAVYRYSDINYVLLQFIVEELTQMPLNEYVRQSFYEPMGLGHITFRPTENYPLDRLVPTITDLWIGRGVLRGYVHDEGAAMLGGVAGHAGLFSNAYDLGRLFQLLNDKGNFAGRQLISEATVELFTEKGPYNYRALGFDRLAGGYRYIVNAGASEKTFGHTGFSGTCVWADPDANLVYVLLTNRIHPDPKNERLMKLDTRSRVHRDIYRALGSYSLDPA